MGVPLVPGTEHSILVEVGWTQVLRVPIDGLVCPGCGTPLHECQDDRGRLTDHTIRDGFESNGRTPRILAGVRLAGSAYHHRQRGHFCEWGADRFAVWAFQLAMADLREAATA